MESADWLATQTPFPRMKNAIPLSDNIINTNHNSEAKKAHTEPNSQHLHKFNTDSLHCHSDFISSNGHAKCCQNQGKPLYACLPVHDLDVFWNLSGTFISYMLVKTFSRARHQIRLWFFTQVDQYQDYRLTLLCTRLQPLQQDACHFCLQSEQGGKTPKISQHTPFLEHFSPC